MKKRKISTSKTAQKSSKFDEKIAIFWKNFPIARSAKFKKPLFLKSKIYKNFQKI